MNNNLEIEEIVLDPFENAKAHKTDKYELLLEENGSIPILRRGTPFTMMLKFTNGNYDENRDIIYLIFSFGSNPDEAEGTKVVIELQICDFLGESESWTAAITSMDSSTVTVEVCAAPNSPVGVWNLQVETCNIDYRMSKIAYRYNKDIYILFNPWNTNDTVHMPEEDLLEEYVLSDIGKIWMGTADSNYGKKWVFGQFDVSVLPAVMAMFEKSEMSDYSYGDPIKVSRLISKLTNSNDDDGILYGRWNNDYYDGTEPLAWCGSIEILREYLQTRMPVRYGQCWVFSGVVTTVCRALGIPARSVTNFVSGHDINASLTIDVYYDIDGRIIYNDPHHSSGGTDSIWNFHVWNDVWMARPDLPKGYGGWQAIDATPQDISRVPEEGLYYQCGPASLEAVKRGNADFKYDVAFVIAMVNADVVGWQEDPSSSLGYKKFYCDTDRIGRCIITKKANVFDSYGNEDKEDITDQYKEREGTEEERVALYNAAQNASAISRRFFSLSESQEIDVVFAIKSIYSVQLGDTLQFTVNVTNESTEIRTVKLTQTAVSVFYTGIKAEEIERASKEFILEPLTSYSVIMEISEESYAEKLVDHWLLQLHAVGWVTETNHTWAGETDIQIEKNLY